MLTPAWTPLRYHPTQSRLWRTTDRFVAVPAGRGSGKTEIAKRRLVRMLPVQTTHGLGPGLYAYTAPTYGQAKRIAWDHLKRLIPPQWVKGTPSESELIIRSIWGSEIHLIGMDKPARIEGVQWDGIVSDESSDQKPGIFARSIRPALSHRNGWNWRIGVPKRYGVGAKEFKNCCQNPEAGWSVFHWTSEDILTPDEIALAKAQLDPKDYDEQYRASWVTAGGKAFHAFSHEHNVVAGPTTQYKEDCRIVVGSDFNVNPMCWVVGHVIAGQLFIFDEIFLRDTNTRATLNELWRRYHNHTAGFLFIGDAAGRQRHTNSQVASISDYTIIKNDERFADSRGGCAVRYPLANPRIKDRLASCNQMFCTESELRRLFISPKCTHLIEDLEDRNLDDDGSPQDAGPDIGHITDALGYLVHGLFPIHRDDPSNFDDVSTKDQLAIFR